MKTVCYVTGYNEDGLLCNWLQWRRFWHQKTSSTKKLLKNLEMRNYKRRI